MLKIAYGLVILLGVVVVVRNAFLPSSTIPVQLLYVESGVLLLVASVLLLSIHRRLKALEDRIDSAVKSANTLQNYLTDPKLTYMLGKMYERVEGSNSDLETEDFEVNDSNNTSGDDDADNDEVPSGASIFGQDFRERLRRTRRVGPR